jgi:hypothetical protein
MVEIEAVKAIVVVITVSIHKIERICLFLYIYINMEIKK